MHCGFLLFFSIDRNHRDHLHLEKPAGRWIHHHRQCAHLQVDQQGGGVLVPERAGLPEK
ncbi:hypothetical protein Scep_014778 [Stephania cephalantha]|uniref:Uncharacterized protein n=1 Tax=Stephania cephalantha TaxID=152367 RepID=A0AAP0NZR1_9MAGN